MTRTHDRTRADHALLRETAARFAARELAPAAARAGRRARRPPRPDAARAPRPRAAPRAPRAGRRGPARRSAARGRAPAVARAERDTGGHLGREEFRALVARAADLGRTTLLLPEELGGGGGTQLDNAVVAEELGAVDVGFAAALNLTATVPGLLLAAGTPEQLPGWAAALTAPGRAPPD